MFQLKEKEYTLNTFIRALKDENNTYVGTYYESPLISEHILAAPTLSFSREGDIIYLGVTLKPNAGEEAEQIKRLDMFMDVVNAGYVDTKIDPQELLTFAEKPVDKFLSQNSVVSEIQDFDVKIIMSEPVVKRMDTVINGVKYWKYSITETIEYDDGFVYSHTVHSLIKEKNSDGENFFSDLVGEDLGKRDTVKVLDSIAQQNITGLFIGGYEVIPINNSSEPQVTSVYHATLDYIRLDKSDIIGKYYVRTSSGGTAIPDESIEKSEVEIVGDGRYTVTVYTSHTSVKFFMG